MISDFLILMFGIGDEIMLSVKTTEKFAGVTVSGTYWGLNEL